MQGRAKLSSAGTTWSDQSKLSKGKHRCSKTRASNRSKIKGSLGGRNRSRRRCGSLSLFDSSILLSSCLLLAFGLCLRSNLLLSSSGLLLASLRNLSSGLLLGLSLLLLSLDLLSLLGLLEIILLLLDIKTGLFSTLFLCKLVFISGVLRCVLLFDLLVLGSLLFILLLLFGIVLFLLILLLLLGLLLFFLLLIGGLLDSGSIALGLLLLGVGRTASLCGSSFGLGLGSSLGGLSGILLLGLSFTGHLSSLHFLVLGALLVICGLAFSSLDLLFFLNLLGIGIGLLLFDCFLSLFFGFLAFSFNSVLLFLSFLF